MDMTATDRAVINLLAVIAQIRDVTGVGDKPSLHALPSAIKRAISVKIRMATGKAKTRAARDESVVTAIRDILGAWQMAPHIRLHAGEMTAAEMRSVKAVVAAIDREIEKVFCDDRG
jgi:hypothetical protein